MVIQLKQLVPYLLLSIFSISSHGKEKPCKCSDSNQDRRRNYTMDIYSPGSRFHVINKAGVARTVGVRDLSHYHNLNNTVVLSTSEQVIDLPEFGQDPLWIDEASFSVTIVYQPLLDKSRSGLAFLILPFWMVEAIDTYDGANSSLAKQLAARDVGPLDLSDVTFGSATVSGGFVSVRIGVLSNLTTLWHDNGINIMVVDVNIVPVAGAPVSNYTVWIDHDRVGRSLSVYVEVEGEPKPDNTIVEANQMHISVTYFPQVYFGLLSTIAQLFSAGGVKCSATVEELTVTGTIKANTRMVTILSSVLGPVTATAVVAAGMSCYFNSRYRRWQKDLDQLARSMERLPWVPRKVDFADINKATNNFHESMRLGGGGFGAVYRCTLAAACSKIERPTDVAVKRFTRDVQNHRYGDFLAEVSIINRLRHKNIVPLIGWSYNKGVPLLVFEYMTNGSIDQHLFPRGGSGTGQRRVDGAIQQWATRCEIVKDIATSLHYVHHEYEPMVLHRDIKASNVMLDSSFRARLGDFGLACTVGIDRNSVTGVGGTWGYIAPEYAMCGKTTRQTDIYALGVLILEVVTGQRALADNHQQVDDDDVHITDHVWRLHREGRLSECVDVVVLAAASDDDKEQMGANAARLLLLGLACSNPNPSDRPAMPEVVQVIAKSVPPPEVPPQKPRFVWPPPEGEASDDDSLGTSIMSGLNRSTGEQQVSLGQPIALARSGGRYASFQPQSAHERATRRHASFQQQHSV